jgi:hypothetical protein
LQRRALSGALTSSRSIFSSFIIIIIIIVIIIIAWLRGGAAGRAVREYV